MRGIVWRTSSFATATTSEAAAAAAAAAANASPPRHTTFFFGKMRCHHGGRGHHQRQTGGPDFGIIRDRGSLMEPLPWQWLRITSSYVNLIQVGRLLLNSLAWQPVDRIAAAANATVAAAALSGLVSLSILASLQSAFLALLLSLWCDVATAAWLNF